MKLNTIMIAFFMVLKSFGQDSSVAITINQDECEKYRSLYYQYMQNEMYLDARSFWLKAYEACGKTPNLDEGFFINGIFIYDNLRKKVFLADSIAQQEVTDSIPWLFEQQLILAPNPLTELKYANFLMKIKSSNFIKITDLLNVVDDLKEETPARYLSLYFRHQLINIYNKANQEEKVKLKTEILETYFRLSHYANKAIEKGKKMEQGQAQEKTLKEYEDAKAFLSKYIIRVINEPELVENALQKQYDLLPVDSLQRQEQITELLKLIQNLGCPEIPVYSKFTYALVKLKPTCTGYTGIGEIEMREADYNKAIEAYLKALDLAETAEEKNDVSYRLAVAYYNTKSYKLAYKYAKGVKGQNQGKALTLCGNSVAALAGNCGESTFEREANYWLANDYYQRAADLGEPVSRSQFSGSWPTSNECFKEGVKAGEKYPLNCWNETTVVR